MTGGSSVLWQEAAAEVRVVHDAVSARVIDPVVEALVDAEWAAQCARAAASGRPYFDSETYRLNRVEGADDVVTLHLAPSAYRLHAAMKVLHARPEVREEHLDRQLVADALVRTADGQIVLHTVEKVVETETYLIGGSCSRARAPIETAADLRAYTLDRVDHVLGLAPVERRIGPLLALVQNEIGCVHAIFLVNVALPAAEVRARFRPGSVSVALEVVPEADYAGWCRRRQGYMRVCAGLVTALPWERKNRAN